MKRFLITVALLAALPAPGNLSGTGYTSIMWTNSTLVGTYYSDVSGKPAIYWFEAIIER